MVNLSLVTEDVVGEGNKTLPGEQTALKKTKQNKKSLEGKRA